jgi:glycine cleavage system H protein
MAYPADLKYTKDHEWMRVSGNEAEVGITDYAQEQLGDVVYVELPDVGRKVEKGKDMAVVESVKAASEVYAPVSGSVTAINDKLTAEPATVNSAAMGDGWFVKIKLSNPSELDKLMDEAAYKKYVEGLG